MRPRAALLPLRALPLLAPLLPALLVTATACSGDRAPASTAETTAAGGATTTATADGTTFGGDTALARTPAAAARPVPGAPATATAPAPGTTSATGTTTGSPTATATTPAGDATAGATATPVPAAATATTGSIQATSLAPAASAEQPATPAATPTTGAGAAASAPRRRAAVPFAPNERLEFDVKFGAIDVGDAAMQLNGIESVRGHEVYHTVFRVSGGTLFFKVNDRYESWIDTRTLVSHRFVQQIDEGSYERERKFEIFPERRVYRENEKPEQETVSEPLDDGSFFYFVRTIPLEVGKTYTFERYFKPKSNPVTIKVLRRERVKVPAGTFDAIVIQPLIKTKGIFGEGGRAEIWLADDSTRAMLQMKSQLKFGSLNLYLKKYRPGVRPVPTP